MQQLAAFSWMNEIFWVLAIHQLALQRVQAQQQP